MFRFENNTYLYLLALIPVFYIIFYISIKIIRSKRQKFAELDLLSNLNPDMSYLRRRLKFLIMMCVLASLIFAIAKPQFGSKLKKVKSKGIEMIIALDVSNSMLAEDIKPNRLEAAKRAITKLVDRLEQDKLGLIIFAGEAFVQIPITNDYSAMKMFLSQINTESIRRQGTNMTEAINLGINSFSPNSEVNKAMVIITDGENHDEQAVDMAKVATEQGVKVYTIGMGYGQGVPIPVKGTSDFKKDKDGNVVITKLNTEVLQQIADAGEGKSIIANNQKIGLNALFDDLNNLEKKELETSIYSEYDNKFQIPLWIALILLIVDMLILERKNKHFKKINLFGKED
jgi:Ca-activated chloride channel family protein